MSALIFLLVIAAIFVIVLATEARDSGEGARPLGLIGWLTGGNWPAKIGGGLLLVGLGALLRYALLNLDVPPPLKLAGGVVTAGVLGLAATLTRVGTGRRAVSLALGGAAFGVAYITAYSAFALFHYYDSFTGTGVLALVAVGTAVYAVTRSSVSLALLAMLGAYLAPAFATVDPGPNVVYGFLAFASLLTLVMVSARGWRPLIHLSLLFTLGGGIFFAWTAHYFRPEYAASMLPIVLILAALQALMPLVERGGARAGWIERLDIAYLLAVPALAGLAALMIAATRLALSSELFSLAAIWLVLGGALALLKRDGALVHGVLGVLLAGLATAARFRDLPWELIGLAFSVLALWLAARRSQSRQLQNALACLVPVMGLLAIMSSVAAGAADPSAVHAQFLERVIGAALLVFAGYICRTIRNGLDTLLMSVGTAWLVVAVGSEVLRWHLISLPLLVNWTFVAAAAFLAATRLRHRLLPEAIFTVVAGVLVTTSWAATVAPPALSWVSLALAPLVLIWLSVRRAGADPETRAGRLLAAAIAPIVAGLWAIHDGGLAGIRDPQFALCAMAVTAALIVALSALAHERAADWRAAAVGIYATSFAVVLGVATTLAISRSPWAIALELAALAGLALVVFTARPEAPAPAWTGPACALGLGLMLQADLLRWLGPPGELELDAIAHMRLTGLISLLWATLGALLTVWAKRRASRMLWVAGATLMVAAAVKFVLFDFGGLGQLGNILAVIAAGVVFLLVGWLAPMPPAATRPPEPVPAAPERAGPTAAASLAARSAVAPRTAPPAAAAEPTAGPMNEYWQRNASAAAGASASHRAASADRTAWIIVILALLVLPLSQCAHKRIRYSDFSYQTARPAVVTMTRAAPATPIAVEATEPASVESEPMAEPTGEPPAEPAPAPIAAPPMPAEGSASADAGQAGGAYKCTQADGSTVFSDTPCSGDAERIQLPPPVRGAAGSAAPTIVSGVYASPRNRQSLDITLALKSVCSGGSCSLNCGNLLAGDPDIGQRKYCRITYRCGAAPGNRQLHVMEGQSIRIACD